MPSADRDVARRVARVQREFARREADLRLDQRRIEAHPIRVRVDVGAGVLQHRSRAVVQEIDPDLLQHGQRGLMDGFEFVPRHEVERREGRHGLGGRSRRPRTRRPRSAPRRRRPERPAAGLQRTCELPGVRIVACDSLVMRNGGVRAPASRENGIGTCQIERDYFAALSFAGSLGAASGSAALPAANRAISQERNSATASLLRSSGWVVR